MVDRKSTKNVHEDAQVAIFLEWLNSRYGASYSVVKKPDPPDAIIQSGRRTRWVEVTDSSWSNEFAADVYSFATPKEVHKSIGTGPFINPDTEFSSRFIDVLKKKLEKESYLESRKLYGPGYLVVPIMYPLFDLHTIRTMREMWSQTKINDLGCFSGIYMTLQMGSGPIKRWSAYIRT